MSNNQWYDIYKNPEKYFGMELTKCGIAFEDITYIQDLVNTYVSMFYFPNLDKNHLLQGATSRTINKLTLFSPSVCFANVPSLGGWIVGTYAPNGNVDLNGHPIEVTVHTANGEAIPSTMHYKDIIPFRVTNLPLPPFLYLLEYIRKIKELDNDVLKLCEVACLPAVITGDKKQAAALKAIATKIGLKNPFITGDSTLVSQIQSFDIKLAISPLDIYDLKSKYKNECLSSMGIYNVEQKRERIVTQELANQNDFSDFAYNIRAKLLKNAVAELKARSGIDIGFEELYDYNIQENLNDTIKETYETAKAEAKGTKDGDPNANTNGGMFNGK